MTNGKKSKTISRIIISVLLVLAIIVTGAGSFFSGVLDTYVGRGEINRVEKPGSENLDKKYYESEFSSAEEADVYAKSVTKKIAAEGMTLLKNLNNVLPLKTSKTSSTDKSVTLFGRRSVDTVFGGTGSGAGDVKQATTILDALSGAGYNVNKTVYDMYSKNLSNVPVATTMMDDPTKTTYYIGEFPPSYYSSDITKTYNSYKDAAIVVLGRSGGEGMDFCPDLKGTLAAGTSAMSSTVAETANYVNGQHQLELSKEEKDLIAHVKSNFNKVIVLINSANAMEIGDLQKDNDIDAIVWMSYPGSRGNDALVEILNGTVTPSGKVVDTWATDFTQDPTFNNTHPVAYNNISKQNALGNSYSVEYEEGIYVGYRYYETVYASNNKFTVNGASGKSYSDAVVYPFGFGLSYASFEQKITDFSVENGKITINISVKNTQKSGGYSGKDVVALYYSSPYGNECLGYTSKVEKSAVELVAFEKTPELKPQQEWTTTLSFMIEDMASYDYLGEKAYILDSGTYTISLRANAHEVYGDDCQFEYVIAKKIVYNADNPRLKDIENQLGEYVNLSEQAKAALQVITATNRFDDLNTHFVSYLSELANNGYGVNMTRNNFAKSFPTLPTTMDLTASQEVIKNFAKYSPNYYNAADIMPITGEKNGLSVVGMRGLPYDHEDWDKLLNQLSLKDMYSLIYAGNQGTINLSSVLLPASTATDGPAGLKQYGGLGMASSGNFNCSSTLVAATWNVELAKEFGTSVGNEAVLAKKNGWYAPGANLHRSAFGGRNFEYYSEDPLLSGLICANTVEGAQELGLTCYLKHFVANDLEMHRVDNGYATWVNEQALRELYLKSFEYSITNPLVNLKYLDENGVTQYKKMRSSLGIMSSFNRLGSIWTGGSGELLNGVLRDEWGFKGTVVTDYNGQTFMNVEWGVTNGNDLMLANESTLQSRFADTKNPSTVIAMRQAVKNILYTHTNSNTVNGVAVTTEIKYGLSPWVLWLILFDAAMVVGAGVIWFIQKKKSKDTIKLEKTDE